jgi:flagellar protein FliS
MELAYRKTAAEGAGFGLMIALYDTLAGDLRRAAEAERNNNIEGRCREVNHALLVIGHLEDNLDRGTDGELAQRLRALYASLRRKLIVAQAQRSAELLELQMAMVLNLRKIWQELELRNEQAEDAPAWMRASGGYDGYSTSYERGEASWSA